MLIGHPRQGDGDLTITLQLHLRFGNAETVDAPVHDGDGLAHLIRGRCAAGRGLGLEDDLQATLQIKAQMRLLVGRIDEEDGRRDEGDDNGEDDDVSGSLFQRLRQGIRLPKRLNKRVRPAPDRLLP